MLICNSLSYPSETKCRVFIILSTDTHTRVRRRGHLVDFALFDDVIRVAARESGTLQQIHHVRFRHHLLVQEILILLGPDDTA